MVVACVCDDDDNERSLIFVALIGSRAHKMFDGTSTLCTGKVGLISLQMKAIFIILLDKQILLTIAD